MLTGERPYDLKDKPVDEVELIVCTIDPPPPSATVSENTTRYTLRGDLDRIVMMALRKEPERRYGSVEAMARDINRYLAGRPVSAQRDTWYYRATKFFRRNRTAVAVVSVIAAMLLVGAGTILWQARMVRMERLRGEQQRQIAEARLQELSNVLFDVHAAIRDLPGAEAARRSIVDNILRDADRLVEVSAGDPRLLAQAAAAYERVGLLEGAVESDVAHKSQGKAIGARQKLLASAPPGDRQRNCELATLHVKIAEIEQRSGHTDSALQHANTAESIGQSAGCSEVVVGASEIIRRAHLR